MKKIFLIILLLNLFNGLFAQKVSNPLKKYEISFLDLILKDSADFHTTIDNNEFKFGTDMKGATFLNITKNKGNIYLQPLGTGRLYKLYKENNAYQTKRIDSTVHSGVNFFSKNFIVRDTMYQYGGLGFWTIRGIMTFFSPQTNQWELVQTNKSIPCFFDYQQDAIIHVSTKEPNPKLYLSNAYYYHNYPQSFDIASVDTCYVFDFNNKNWKSLGKINPEFKRILLAKNSLAFDLGKYLLVQSALEFYWIDFEENIYGKIKSKYSTEIRQLWLSIYNNETNVSTNFQFNIDKNIYLLKLTKDRELEYKKYSFNPDMIDFSTKNYIYSDKIDLTEAIAGFFDNNKTLLLNILAAIALAFFIFRSSSRKKKMPKEVVSILNNNFFSALTIVEKELIEELYKYHLKGEALSTKLINKIIGVQQKDTLTQNKSRSDYFIRINQKFKMATQHSEPLIIKHRDTADKRQYNYSINLNYIEDIEKLLHN